MLSHNDATRDYIEQQARSALPNAPTIRAPEKATPRRVIASLLVTLADRIAPEPVERSRWQSG